MSHFHILTWQKSSRLSLHGNILCYINNACQKVNEIISKNQISFNTKTQAEFFLTFHNVWVRVYCSAVNSWVRRYQMLLFFCNKPRASLNNCLPRVSHGEFLYEQRSSPVSRIAWSCWRPLAPIRTDCHWQKLFRVSSAL